MPFKFGKKSEAKLLTVNPALQLVFRKAIKLGLIDVSITDGRRTQAEQNRLFEIGRSKVKWPHGKHNVIDPFDLANAVDAAPFVNGQASYERPHCIYLAGIVMAIATDRGFKIRWGGNWDMDAEPVTDQDFQDLVHFEIVE